MLRGVFARSHRRAVGSDRLFRPFLENLEQRCLPSRSTIFLDEPDHRGAVFSNPIPDAFAGDSVAAAGDVNGDGYADFLVGTDSLDDGGVERGEAYLIFGGPNLGGLHLDLSDIGTGGFAMRGFADNGVDFSISGAGDVNDDGFDDIVIGSEIPDPRHFTEGVAYVILGGNDLAGQVIELDHLGDRGFTILGGEHVNRVAGAGDVNGDGIDDLLIGIPNVLFNENDEVVGFGEVFVVYGASDLRGKTLALDTLGDGGFVVEGIGAPSGIDGVFDRAGDVNHDGLADIIVGSSLFDDGLPTVGAAYVVYGSAELAGTAIAVNDLGTHGFTLQGSEGGAMRHSHVAGAGDVNGDGYDDVVVTAPDAAAGGELRGEIYVIFGGNDLAGVTFPLDGLGSHGFTIRGVVDGAEFGKGVAGAGDVNADGLTDVIVIDDETVVGTNVGYVIFSRADYVGKVLSIETLGSSRWSFPATSAGHIISACGAGDVNGDGADDVVMGADGAFLVFGTPKPLESEVRLDSHGNLTITDPINGPKDDSVTLQSDTHKKRIIIRDPENQLKSYINGAIQVDVHTIYVPFRLITGSSIVVNTLDGDDCLTVDYGLGGFSKKIVYDGGQDQNELRLRGGFFAKETIGVTGAHSGTVQLGAELQFVNVSQFNDTVGAWQCDFLGINTGLEANPSDETDVISVEDGPKIDGLQSATVTRQYLLPVHLTNKWTLDLIGTPIVELIQISIPIPVGGLRRLMVEAGGGDDYVDASGATVPVRLLGGEGFDQLFGSPLDDILLGGAGIDLLHGGKGRDLLIGGPDGDLLDGGDGDDLLVAGDLKFPPKVPKATMPTLAGLLLDPLDAIMSEWTQKNCGYALRVAHLKGTRPGGKNGKYKINATTVVKDQNLRNQVSGGKGLDWFVVTLGGDDNDQIDDLGLGGHEITS